jgi:hypothetical protein
LISRLHVDLVSSRRIGVEPTSANLGSSRGATSGHADGGSEPVGVDAQLGQHTGLDLSLGLEFVEGGHDLGLVLVRVPSHAEAHVKELLLLLGKALGSHRVLLDLLGDDLRLIGGGLINTVNGLHLLLSLDGRLLFADQSLPGALSLGGGHLNLLLFTDLKEGLTPFLSLLFVKKSDLFLILSLFFDNFLFLS